MVVRQAERVSSIDSIGGGGVKEEQDNTGLDRRKDYASICNWRIRKRDLNQESKLFLTFLG